MSKKANNEFLFPHASTSSCPRRAPRIWVTWETQRRNKELAEAFACDYLKVDLSGHGRLTRYLRGSWIVLSQLFSRRDSVVFVQCPSIVSSFLVSLVAPLRGAKVVIDAHNSAINYLRSSNIILRIMAKMSYRAADFIIVSNEHLKAEFSGIETPLLVLPDKLPYLDLSAPIPEPFRDKERPLVVLISTFAEDEPIEVFIKGVQALEHKISLVVTGRRSKAGDLLKYENENLIFSDFLPEADFDALIVNSDLIVDLTTREHCLVCGAYEAVSAEVPSLLSDTKALRETFPRGALFAANTSDDYAEALAEFVEKMNYYKQEQRAMRSEFERAWQESFLQVERVIAGRE